MLHSSWLSDGERHEGHDRIREMKRLGWIIGVLGLIVLLWLAVCAADELANPGDGRLDDPFLENLVGEWQIARRIRDTVVGNTLTAE